MPLPGQNRLCLNCYGPQRNRAVWFGLLLGVVLTAVGCAPRPRVTEFFIDDYRGEEALEQLSASFERAYFATNAGGTMDIVAISEPLADSNPETQVAQVLHIRQVYPAVPGRTFVEDSMINATVCYALLGPGYGQTYEGGGFVTYSQNWSKDKIAGRLKSATVEPLRRVGQSDDLLHKAVIHGTFVAHEDKRQVLRVLNDLDRLFGPKPNYTPPPVDPNFR